MKNSLKKIRLNKICGDCGAMYATYDLHSKYCRVCVAKNPSLWVPPLPSSLDEKIKVTFHEGVFMGENSIVRGEIVPNSGLGFITEAEVEERKVSLIITTMNEWYWTQQTIDTLKANTVYPYTLTVLDACSTDGTPDNIREQYPEVNLVELDNKYWVSYAWNIALEIGKEQGADFIGILNNDLTLYKYWLKGLIHAFNDPHVGLVSPIQNNPNGRVRDIGKMTVGSVDCTVHHSENIIVPFMWTTGACFILRKEAIEDVGKFDENFIFGCDELDYCLRLWTHGWKVVATPFSQIIHHVSKTIGKHKGQKGNRSKELLDNYGVVWRLPRHVLHEKWSQQSLTSIYRTVYPEHRNIKSISQWNVGNGKVSKADFLWGQKDLLRRKPQQ